MFPKLRNLFFHHYLKKCNFASWWRYALISQGVFHCPALLVNNTYIIYKE